LWHFDIPFTYRGGGGKKRGGGEKGRKGRGGRGGHILRAKTCLLNFRL